MDKETLKNNIDLIHHMKNLPTLKFFGKEDLKKILHFSQIKRYKPGEVIIEEGANDKYVYILISGKVKVSKLGEEIDTLQRTGDIFGEMCVIDGGPRSASVTAVDDALCIATDISFVDKLPADDQVTFCAVFYQIIAEVLARRLRETSEELVKEQTMREILSDRLKKANEEIAKLKSS